MQKTKKAEGRRAMSVQLLDKTRKINKLLHNNNSSKVVFNDICEVLSEILESNVLVISKKGKVLGISITPNVEEIKELIDDEVGGHIDELLNERFLGVLSTKENVNLETLGFESGDVKNIRQLSIRSILQESVSVRYLCTNAEKDMILMISSSASMVRPWSVWK